MATFPALEQLCEELDGLKLVELTPTNEWHSASVSLTKVSRNYGLMHGKVLGITTGH